MALPRGSHSQEIRAKNKSVFEHIGELHAPIHGLLTVSMRTACIKHSSQDTLTCYLGNENPSRTNKKSLARILKKYIYIVGLSLPQETHLARRKRHWPKDLLCRFYTCWIFHIEHRFDDHFAMRHTIPHAARQTAYSLVCKQLGRISQWRIFDCDSFLLRESFALPVSRWLVCQYP